LFGEYQVSESREQRAESREQRAVLEFLKKLEKVLQSWFVVGVNFHFSKKGGSPKIQTIYAQ